MEFFFGLKMSIKKFLWAPNSQGEKSWSGKFCPKNSWNRKCSRKIFGRKNFIGENSGDRKNCWSQKCSRNIFGVKKSCKKFLSTKIFQKKKIQDQFYKKFSEPKILKKNIFGRKNFKGENSGGWEKIPWSQKFLEPKIQVKIFDQLF